MTGVRHFAWFVGFAVSCAAPSGSGSGGAASALQAELSSRPLDVTRHGSCRMSCRGVDDAEIRDVILHGELDPERTREDGPCTSYALHGRGTDGARLRVVVAGCDDVTRLVTVVDLDRDWPCDCE